MRLLAAIAALCLPLAALPAKAETVGKVGVDWVGNDITVEAIPDPKVHGVTCHLAYFDRALIDRLLAHCTGERYVHRHSWRPGDLVIWDNRATLHRATTDYTDEEHRLMHRTTAIGEVPIPVAA